MSDDYIKLLMNKIDGIQTGVTDIEARMARLDQKFVDHEDAAAQLQEEVKALKAEAAELRGRIATLEQVKESASLLTQAFPWLATVLSGAIAVYVAMRG